MINDGLGSSLLAYEVQHVWLANYGKEKWKGREGTGDISKQEVWPRLAVPKRRKGQAYFIQPTQESRNLGVYMETERGKLHLFPCRTCMTE